MPESRSLHIRYLIGPLLSILEWATLIISIAAYVLANNGKKDIATLLLVVWTQVCMLLPYARWLCQSWILREWKLDPTYIAKMNYLCNIGRIPIGGELAAISKNSYIPKEIQTEHQDAREILQSCQQHPYIWTISTTFQDWNTLKFAWLKTHKNSLEDIERHLIPGDIILYHDKKSLLGKIIRSLTKNYWEHSATYIGNGQVMDVAPGGCRRVFLKTWTSNQNIDIAIFRNDDVKIEFFQNIEGRGYNYIGVAREFVLLVNKQRTALLTETTLIFTTAVISLMLFFFAFRFGYFRMTLIFSFFACLFLIHQSRSPVAYLFPNNTSKQESNEKP